MKKNSVKCFCIPSTDFCLLPDEINTVLSSALILLCFFSQLSVCLAFLFLMASVLLFLDDCVFFSLDLNKYDLLMCGFSPALQGARIENAWRTAHGLSRSTTPAVSPF